MSAITGHIGRPYQSVEARLPFTVEQKQDGCEICTKRALDFVCRIPYVMCCISKREGL